MPSRERDGKLPSRMSEQNKGALVARRALVQDDLSHRDIFREGMPADGGRHRLESQLTLIHLKHNFPGASLVNMRMPE